MVGLLAASVATLVTIVLAGCREAPTTPGQQSQQTMMRRADRGEALLAAATAQLADLPSAVDTQLRPPAVILDSTKSGDGQDVLATCTTNPQIEDGPINYIRVPAANSRFRSLGVRPGDILKYYVLRDQTVDEERLEFGLARQVAIELTVAQVLDDSTLLIAGGLSAEVPVPMKIEIWRYLDARLEEIREKLQNYVTYRLPPVGWHPSPDGQVINQIVAWLNQWLRQSAPTTDWQRDPLLDTLDSALLTNELLTPFLDIASLSAEKFQPYYDELQPAEEQTMRDSLYDGRLLQEAVWLRDISRWAQGGHFNAVARAGALFDWTVRNVQLVADEHVVPRRPWQVLLHGHGTAEQRAWVFAMLARQQGLDVVMLAVDSRPSADRHPTPDTRHPANFWLPALVEGGQLYLFDARLGLSIPGPGGEGVATLQQVLADDSLLRQLDLDEAPYPISADALEGLVAGLVADPFDLSRRARQVESRLTGDDQLVLTSHPSELAERLQSVPELTGARLWDVPFRTLRDQLALGRSARHREALAFEPFAIRPVLWKARARHFQGRHSESARGETIDDHREAAQLYTSKRVRPTDREIAQTPSAERRRIDITAKLNATYWVGLLSFDNERYDVAAHWLDRPELTAAESPWWAGARYNLARTFEAQEDFDEAIKLLEQDTSPQQHGNRLRARWLKSRIEAANESD